MLLLTHLYYWPGRPCMRLPPIPRLLIVSPLQSPVAVHRGSPRVPVVIYVDQPFTAAMVISPPIGHVGSVVPPARYPIVAAAVAAAIAAALPDSYESHFPLARVTRERKCAHSSLAASSSSSSPLLSPPTTLRRPLLSVGVLLIPCGWCWVAYRGFVRLSRCRHHV